MRPACLRLDERVTCKFYSADDRSDMDSSGLREKYYLDDSIEQSTRSVRVRIFLLQVLLLLEVDLNDAVNTQIRSVDGSLGTTSIYLFIHL